MSGAVDRAVLDPLLGGGPATIPAVLAARAEATPEGRFLWTEERRWSYEEGVDEIARFAGMLAGRGTGAGRRVAGFLPNCPAALWAWFGTLWAGATYVPLNRAQRGELLAELVARSRAELLVTDREGAALLHAARVSSDVSLLLVDVAETEAANGALGWGAVDAAAVAPLATPAETDLALVLFTSGTTGRSKATQIPHRQCVRGAAAVAWSLELGRADVFHCWWPLFHVAGMIDTVLPSVLGGASVALYSGFSRSGFFAQIECSRATIFGGMANILELLWSLPPGPADTENSLRAGLIGYIPPGMRAQFEQRFGLVLQDTYGMTEIEPIALPHPGVECPEGSCGRPNPDLEVAILDEANERLPSGAEGEIAVRPLRPATMFAGYEADPEATLEACRDFWFHTGDLGRMDAAGNLYFTDRLKDVIRRRGENISTWELERAISVHEAVAECAALGVPSPLGEDDVKVVVVAHAEATLTPSALHDWCAGAMAAFMRPRYIEIRAALPRGVTGKVLKTELRETGDDVWDAERAGGERHSHSNGTSRRSPRRPAVEIKES